MPSIAASSSGSHARQSRGRSAVRTSSRAKSSQQQPASPSTSNTTIPAPILRTHSPSSPPVKSILIVHSSDRIVDGDDESNRAGEATEAEENDDTATPTNSSSASYYLKPLLKYLPRHIDPSTIARLLKNVHPSAFGSYRTKEAWRREHPEVLNTARHILRQEQAEAEGLLDIESSHAVLRPSVSSDEVCLAHSPPSATFSSSEDDDFDEEFAIAEEEQEEFERREAKELEEYFNDDFDDGLSTSPESVSSLRDLASRRDSLDSTTAPSLKRRNRASSQDSITTAKNDKPASTTSFLADLAATTLSSPKSPLAIYLSKPDEEQDSPLAGPSQRVLNLKNHQYSSSSSSPDRSNDSSITVVPSVDSHRRESPIASTSAAILYPREPANSISALSNRPRTPPSPSSSSVSPCASPSLLHSPSYSSSTTRRKSPSSPSGTTSISQPNSQYPTISIPRIVKRSSSTSSFASSSNCTCQSNTSNMSNASSNASRSSSVTFAPLPEEELKKAKLEKNLNNGNNGKSKIMGLKGRRNLLLGLNGDEEQEDSAASPSSSHSNSRTALSASYRRGLVDTEESSEDDDDDEIGSSLSSSSSSSRRNHTRGTDQFDAIAYFGEEDLFVTPSTVVTGGSSSSSIPSSSSSLTRDNTIKKRDVLKNNAIPVLEEEKDKNRRKGGSEVTIHYGRNGEVIERRPLGVTLEELTLPMKRVKETRGRSRTKNDLSASFTSPKPLSSPPAPSSSGRFTSPPTSPTIPSSSSTSSSNTTPSSIRRDGLTNPPISPSRSFNVPVPTQHGKVHLGGDMVIGSPESGNDKTPMATPRLEKKDLFMTSSIHVKTSPFPTTLVNASTSSSTPSSSTSQALSPTSKDSESQLMLSGTSPTGSTHSKSASNGSGSNDITPMPTPRAGSPIAGLRMTPSTTILPSSNSFATHSQQSLQDFKLSDSTSFTLRSSSLSPRKESHQKIGQKKDYSSITDDNDNVENDILKVSPVVNVLALGGLLDDTLSPAPPHHREYTPSPASSVGSAVPSLSTTTGSSPEPDNSSERVENNVGEVGQLPDEDRLDTVSSKVPPNDRNDADVEAALISSDDNANEEEEEEDFDETDFDKTPTLHTSMELPKSNDTTTHALNARYRKKRTVGIPHVTARKRVLSISSSKKNKKS